MLKDFKNNPNSKDTFGEGQRNSSKQHISYQKQRVCALALTVLIGIGGFYVNHMLKMKYDVDYILSHSSRGTDIHLPDWDNTDLFLLGIFGGMEFLRKMD